MPEIFIIGSKGIPARYGGFETFVDRLTEKKLDANIKYHVACLHKTDNNEFVHNNSRCFNVSVPSFLGSAGAVYYDMKSLRRVVDYINKNGLRDAVIYILTCRIGPFINWYIKKVRHLNVKVYVNPDGHEWKRAKWNAAIRRYWKFSERLSIKNADLIICDSKSIESYVKKTYRSYQPQTTFIAYGADVKEGETNREKYHEWLVKHGLKDNEYYLIVGRFVPENNYELVIKEFMKSKTNKKLAIISNVENNKFYKALLDSTHFDNDSRIMFVGTVYDQDLLTSIRKGAFAYFHGHEVGGTNPSLLEALATTKINVLLDVNFNREVGEAGGVYFTKEPGNLAQLIEKVEKIDSATVSALERNAKARINDEYNWSHIVSLYEKLFVERQTSKVLSKVYDHGNAIHTINN